ncbi:ArsC family reductase [Idiomarina xiamenensis]|uniref:Arsenate reductase n=1 Tax=Idiomarina xiamenensis 10-D-4 TaxID=740709 RepID=K2JTU9_9GAMM|nr:ArsC family reductase [Idiomarina xiamenensis]EKE86871.1 hypothetical protein A10D4_01477 [Idiomarina xiamenensis 10-D-4]
MSVEVYGINNCDTVKKARRWLEQQQIEYRFHDFRKDGLEKSQLDEWCEQLGWQNVINRRSTSWRELDDETKQALNEAKAKQLMLNKPTLIKRPILNDGEQILNGFNEKAWEQVLR